MSDAEAATSPAPAPRTLRHRAFSAGRWVGAGQVAAYAIRLGSNLLLTRMLAPESFGLMAIVTVVSVILALLSDVGLHPCIVKSERGDDEDFLNTAWSIQIIRGGIIYACAVMVAGGILLANHLGLFPASSTYAEPILPALICVSSLSAILIGFQSTKLFSAFRRLDMRCIVRLEMTVQVVTTGAILALAWFLHSIWAVVLGGLVGSITHLALTHAWLPGRPNRLMWDKSALVELVGFGRWVLLSSTVGVLASNGDRLLLGGLVSAGLLGLYSIGLNLSTMAVSVISTILGTILLPALSEVARTAPERLRSTYLRVRKFSDGIFLASSGFLFAAAQSIVDLLYDHRYADAGTVLRILSLSPVVARYSIVKQVYLAIGEPKYNFRIGVIQVVTLYLTVPLAYAVYGFHGAIFAIALNDVFTLPLIFRLNAKHDLNDFRYEIAILLVWPLGWGLGAVAAVALAWRW
jgi:O-antigen/teichoic acid export membrane protein